jgi:hypothetical protein
MIFLNVLKPQFFFLFFSPFTGEEKNPQLAKIGPQN